MKFLLKKTDNNFFVIYFFFAKLLNTAASFFVLSSLIKIVYQEKMYNTITLILFIYFILIILLIIINIIGNTILYNFLKLFLDQNHFSTFVSKKYFFSICSKISFIISLIIFIINFSLYMVYSDIELLYNFQLEHIQTLNSVLSLLGYVAVGLVLKRILKNNTTLFYVSYSILPYSLLIFIVQFGFKNFLG